MMNISYFLRPKVTVTYLTDDCPVRQALDDMLKSGFTAVPVVSPKGKYVGTITEGDFLRLLLQRSAEDLDKMTVGQVERRVRHRSVTIDARMEDMVDLAAVQNFVRSKIPLSARAFQAARRPLSLIFRLRHFNEYTCQRFV